MDIKAIVTHPGGAHKDDFLACSVMLFHHNVPIYRREPTAADIADPQVCVIDVGGEHAPERMNFDHHQFPNDYVPTCALSLVLQHFNLYEEGRKFCDWLETTEWFDTRGMVKTAQWMGVERSVMGKLNSPIDLTCLRRFAYVNELNPGDVIWELMRMVGEDMVLFLRSARERIEFIHKHGEIWELGGGLKVIYMPRTEPVPNEPSAGLGKYIENEARAQGCVAMVYPDRRGSGFGLTRFNDDQRLDFTKVGDCDDVHFAHNAGFIAKTTATEIARLQELLRMAWLGE